MQETDGKKTLKKEAESVAANFCHTFKKIQRVGTEKYFEFFLKHLSFFAICGILIINSKYDRAKKIKRQKIQIPNNEELHGI